MARLSPRGWLLLGVAGASTAFHAPRLTETLGALRQPDSMQEQMWAVVFLVHAILSLWSLAGIGALLAGAPLAWLVPASLATVLLVAPPAAAAPDTLDGLPFPDLPISDTRQPQTEPETVTVQTGDTLWSIAATRLPDDASNRRIDASVRRLYSAHRDVIGPDPDLIVPGQRLTVREGRP